MDDMTDSQYGASFEVAVNQYINDEIMEDLDVNMINLKV